MSKAGNILQVDGQFENVKDWALATQLRAAGFTNVVEKQCLQYGSDHVSAADIAAADGGAFYSYGGASLYKLIVDAATGGGNGGRAVKASAVFVCVAIVPDVWFGQGGRFLKLPVARQICLQPTKAIPVSQPLGPDGEVMWFDFKDPDIKQRVRDNPFVNINCDSLFPDPCLNIFAAVNIHVTIMNRPEILDFSQWAFEELM